MALMFNRLANNFAINGYFPTDEASMSAILPKLKLSDGVDGSRFALIDPCCGEGSALADIRKHLVDSTDQVDTQMSAWGIEYNHARAWNAKQWLDTVAHADIHDMVIKQRQFGLLFLNPPYGDLVSDGAKLSDAEKGRKRLEKDFFRRAHPWLAFGGVLVLIVPHYVMDSEFAQLIAKSYSDVEVYLAPEQRFKQCVIFGIKRKSERYDSNVVARLERIANEPSSVPTLDPLTGGKQYEIPALTADVSFSATRINAEELADEVNKLTTQSLWPQFGSFAGLQVQTPRRPLKRLTKWHLALALAAGQVSGVMRSDNGRILLVKGDTFKDVSVAVVLEETGSKGETREIRTTTDKFVACIRAFDFTPGSPMFGHIVTVK